MRRAALWLAAIGSLGGPRLARAEPWTLTMETGAEADSNVARVETGGSSDAERIAAPAARAGARIDHKDRVLGGAYALDVSGLARMVTTSQTWPDNQTESVMLYSGEARWLRAIEGRPIAAGVGITAADALAITGGIGARTFRNLGADALLLLAGGDDRHLTFAAGVRDFVYKPDHSYDWRGPGASARLDLVLWQPEHRTHSLELATTLAFEQRTYASHADFNECPAGTAASSDCSMPTSLVRRDRYQRATVQLDWIGDLVATLGYQLTVIDSNSYGQSLVRHRITAAVTTELADKLFATATATLQIDQFPDGLLVENDVQRQEFTSLEDENHSSLQVRIARELTAAWSVESRGAIWRDLGNTGGESFRRELVYAGVVYSH
jgi:hypothetical protein